MTEAGIPNLDPDRAFPRRSGEVGDLTVAMGVMLGQLGTPADTVRYATILADEHGDPLTGDRTYVATVPAGILHDQGYFSTSITAYGSDNKLLIPNDLGIYDRTTYSAEPNPDGTYTITLNPSGDGINGIPTDKPFYCILRAYVPVQGSDMRIAIATMNCGT